MKQLDLAKLNEKIEQMVKDRDWDQFHSVKNLSMALSIESSELMEIFQWLTEEESNNIKDNQKKKAQLEDEVADIFVYLLRIVSKNGIDLEQAVLNKLEKNCAKYPIESAKGNAKKYNEF